MALRDLRSTGGKIGRSALALLLVGTTVAVAPVVAGAQEDGGDSAVQFTFENLQPDDGFFFTEAWVGLHDGDFDLFDFGDRATPGLESLAEGGNTEALGAEFAQQGRLQATIGNGDVQFISPGETIEGSIDIINPAAYQYASFASMIIPSNDAFFGNEDPFAYQVFDDDGNFTGDIEITITRADIWDAGTEVNDAQGAAGFSLGPNGDDGGTSTDDLSSVVAAHPSLENLVGIQTAAGTTVLSELEDPNEEVARITITVGDSLETQSAVGPLFNGSVPDAAPAPEIAGTFNLVDQNFGRYLNTAPDANVGTVNQATTATQFNLVGTDDGYLLQSVSTGLYLTAGDADTALDRYNVTVGDPGPGVFWDLVDLGDGTYRIYNIETNRFLDADRRNDFNVDTSTQERPDTAWQLIALDGPTADDDALGAAFVQTNDLDNNAVAAFRRNADGTLTDIGLFETGGQGSTDFDGGEGLDPLISADSLVVTEDEQFLLTVNAGSNDLVSFRINDDFSLTRISVVDSGGVGPNSVAVDDGYVFVTNIDRDGVALGDESTPRAEPNDEGNVVGFSISADGVLTPTGYSVDLDNRPANIEFSTDGDRVIVSSITSGSAALPGENSEASVYSFNLLRSGRLLLADTNTPTLRGNAEGRNLPSAIDFDITVQDGREFVVVTEAREFNSEGAPPALPALQAGSVTVYELGADSSLTITESDFAFTDGDAAAPNDFGASEQSLTACWIDFGHGANSDIFYVSNAISATISSVQLLDDGTLNVLDTVAAAGVSGFSANPGEAIDGPTTFGTTDGFIDLDVSPDGGYLYQLEGLSGEVSVYALGADGTGSLEHIQDFATDLLPEIDTQGIITIGGGS